MIPRYDAEADALYIEFQPTDDPLSEDMEDPSATLVMVDLDADDHSVVGVEVVSPDAGWDVEAIIRRYGLPPKQAEPLRMLSRVVWRHQAPLGSGSAADVILVPA